MHEGPFRRHYCIVCVPAAAASGDVGGGILASIPSLPSSSSRPSARSSSGSSTAKTRRTSSRSSAPSPGVTVKNDGSTRRLRLEDEDTSTATVAGRPRSVRETGTSNAKAKAQRSAGESRSRQATKSSTSKRRPPVAPAPVVSSSSQNPTDRRKATKSSTSTSSNASSATRKRSQKATPTGAAIASRQKQQRTAPTPSLKVSAKENVDDAAAASDDVLGAHAEGTQKADAGAGASNQDVGGDVTATVATDGSATGGNGEVDGATGTCSKSSKGSDSDDAPGTTTKDTEKEPEQPEAMSANSTNPTTNSTATTDADCTSPTKARTFTTNSKGNRGGLPPKPVSSATASATGTSIMNSAIASKRKAVPSKSGGGGKPPTPRSASSGSSGGRTKPPTISAGMPTASTAPGAVRNGKPPTPRSRSIAGNTSAGDDDESTAGAAVAATGATSTKRTTFLSGYNLDCTKTSSLLDLPDPPTPEDDDGDGDGSSLQDRKAKRRRRMSTGTAAFGSRRNIGTPGGGNGMGTDDGANLGNRSTSGKGDGVPVGAAAPRSIVFDDLSTRSCRDSGKGQRRKVRNSLCHVPSPAETSSMPSSTVAGNSTVNDDGDFKSQNEKPAHSTSTDADANQDLDDKPSPVEKGGICFDDDNDDDDDDNDATDDDGVAKKRRKKQQQRSSRSKKRQSVFLPSDLMHLSSASGRQSGVGASIEGNDANEFYSDLLSYKASATSTASADSSMSLCSNASIGSNVDANDGKVTATEQPSALCEDPNTSNLLLKAVREICSLPESKRYDSDQAGVVELLGGYPYIPPAEKERMKVSKSRNEDAKKMAAGEKGDGNDLNWTFSPSTPGPKPADDPPMSPVDPIAATLEKRRELILTLGPVVERMEAKRKEDTEAARQATGCRVSRTKKGRYKYYDLDTGNEVSPEEYKRRYFAMISGNHGGDQDQSSDPAPSPEAQAEMEEENATVAKETDSGDTRDLQDEGPDQESSTHDMSIDEDGDDMDISLMSMQDVEDVVSKDAIAEEASNEASNENDSLNIEPNASSTEMRGGDEVEAEEEKVASPAPGKPNQPSSPSSADFILPLPDRDDPDTDPQIAAAERRLWSDIDAALARYSRDVISIRAARKMGFNLSQTAESP